MGKILVLYPNYRKGDLLSPGSAYAAPSVSKKEPDRLSQSWLLPKGSSGVHPDTGSKAPGAESCPFPPTSNTFHS